MKATNNNFPIEALEERKQELIRQTEELKKTYPLYPIYNKKIGPVTDTMVEVTLESLVRIQREGSYYLILCRLQHSIPNAEKNITNIIMEQITNMFHTNVYRALILHRLDFSLVTPDGSPVIYADTDQRSEEERLSELFKF
jgi:hypothetical protein